MKGRLLGLSGGGGENRVRPLGSKLIHQKQQLEPLMFTLSSVLIPSTAMRFASSAILKTSSVFSTRFFRQGSFSNADDERVTTICRWCGSLLDLAATDGWGSVRALKKLLSISLTTCG